MEQRKTILFVEDNKQDELLTMRALKQHHGRVEVAVCRDGAEALDWIFSRGQYANRDNTLVPNVILLDLKLPKVDGHQVLRTIRNDPRTKRLPVVILTTSKEASDLATSYDNGANSYVHKPVSFDDFSEVVKSLGVYWLDTNEPPRLTLIGEKRV
jgi:CheY-like chemotaxis protein